MDAVCHFHLLICNYQHNVETKNTKYDCGGEGEVKQTPDPRRQQEGRGSHCQETALSKVETLPGQKSVCGKEKGSEELDIDLAK